MTAANGRAEWLRSVAYDLLAHASRAEADGYTPVPGDEQCDFFVGVLKTAFEARVRTRRKVGRGVTA